MQQVNNIDAIETFRPSLSTIAADISRPGNSEDATDQETRIRLFFNWLQLIWISCNRNIDVPAKLAMKTSL